MDSAAPQGCPKYLKLAKGFERHSDRVLRVGDRGLSVRQLRTNTGERRHVVGCYLWLEPRATFAHGRNQASTWSRAPLADGPAPAVSPRQRSFDSAHGHRPRHHSPSTRTSWTWPCHCRPILLPMNRLNRSIRLALSAFSTMRCATRFPRQSQAAPADRPSRLPPGRDLCARRRDFDVWCDGSAESQYPGGGRAGDVVAVESPGCYEILQALESLTCAPRVPHVPGKGIDLDLLAVSVRKHELKAIVLNATCTTRSAIA